MKHTFKRNDITGALSNTDITGFNQAKLRRKLAVNISKDKIAKQKEITNLKSRLTDLETLVQTLIHNTGDK